MIRLRAEHRLPAFILVCYALLALTYSLVTPPFEASDELWHYPMVKYVADHGLQLPIQDPAVVTAWRQEGSQPPLYYLIAAALTAWIDTDDLDHWRRVNPHADIGVMPPDGNINMIVHRPDERRMTGSLLALQVSRLFSVVLGGGTVFMTYRLGRELFPDRREIALSAMAFNASLPMFLFISGSVNNDNLASFLGALLTIVVIRLLRKEQIVSVTNYGILGIAAGTGLLAKLNLGFFIPVIALSLILVSLRQRNWRPVVIGGFISGGLTVLIAGWWYLRNWQLYGDPTGLNVFLDIVGRRAIPANAAQLWSERDSFLQAFWGFFGGMNVPLPDAVYVIFNVLGALGVVGVLAYLIGQLGSRASRMLTVAHLVTLLWIVVTFVSYLRWTAETPASQGRLVFGALSSICVWLAVGWCWWLPQQARALTAAPAAFSVTIAALTPWLIIAPAYQPPASLWTSSPADLGRPQDATLEIDAQFAPLTGGGQLSMLGARVETPEVRPEQYAHVSMGWIVEAPVSRDWSLFVHLVSPDGVIIGQRDRYPGAGLLATSDLAAQSAWLEPIAVWIPANAYAPQTLDIVVGWYHLPSGERMSQLDGSETYTVGQVELLPRTSDVEVPNPSSIIYAHQIELIGYSLSDLSPAQGTDVRLTLYWRGLRAIEQDYVVFAQIIDPKTTTIYAASDAMPAAWNRPTSTWTPGEIIEDVHTLSVRADAPPGIYEVFIGLYTRAADGGFDRLRVVTADGGQAFDYAQLSRVRIVPEGM